MPKDRITRPTDTFWIEKERVADILAATTKLNPTAKFLCEVLLRRYANRKEFEASGKLVVFPYTDKPTTAEPRSGDYPPLTAATALSPDQLHRAFATLTELKILEPLRRGRHGRATLRAFNLKIIAELAVEISKGTHRTVDKPTLRTVEEPTDSTLEESTDVQLKNPLNNLLDLDPDNPPDQARARAREGGGDFDGREEAEAEFEEPTSSPRQTTRAENSAIADDALRTRYDAVMSGTLFKVNPNYSREKLISHHVRKMRAEGYSAEIILAVARVEAKKVQTRRLQDFRYRAPLPMAETQMQRCEEMVIQQERKQLRERERAEAAAAEATRRAANEAAKEKFITSLRPMETAYYDRQGRTAPIEWINRTLSERFDTLRFAVIDLKTGKTTAIFQMGDFIGWRTDRNVPQTIDDLVEAASRFADCHPDARPEIEPMAAILAEIVNRRLEYANTKTSHEATR